jgi:GAF domain-containing protein
MNNPPEAVLDDIARSAAQGVGAPVGLVSLVDEDRQFFRSSTTADGPLAAQQETPLPLSLCRHAVASRSPLMLADARADPAFKDHPAVQGGLVGAYLGVPIFVDDGQPIGTVCVVDDKARDWGPAQIELLERLAREVAAAVARRTALADAKARQAAARAGLMRAQVASPGRETATSDLSALSASFEGLDPAEPPGRRVG